MGLTGAMRKDGQGLILRSGKGDALLFLVYQGRISWPSPLSGIIGLQ